MSQTITPKPIPVITWNNILPPFKEHVYFEHHHAFLFHWTAAGFDLTNAWWLSEAALLAYADPAFARPRFNNAGLSQVRFFSGTSTQCYVADNPDGIIIAFRGTQGDPRTTDDFVADLKADLDIRLEAFDSGGSVHQGFNNALDQVWPDIAGLLNDPALSERPLWFTGHSLGAALAILAAARLGAAQGVYVFGCPRVGDQAFVDRLNLPIYRFVNNNDVVTHLPPAPYRDAGEMRYIDNRGTLHERIDTFDRWLDEIQGRLRGFFTSFKHGRPAFVPDGIKDHTPLLYALHIWNNLVRGNNKADE